MSSNGGPSDSSTLAGANGNGFFSKAPEMNEFAFAQTVVDRTVYIQKLNGTTRITPQARRYALEELARRAGVPESFYRTWKITTEQNRTVIEIANGRCIRITFPHASADVFHDLSQGKIRVSRAGWMGQPPTEVRELVPDFIVPFARKSEGRIQPLFMARSQDEVECSVDLPLSILLTLSRWEETLTTERDVHGRFAADQSVAVRENFLHRPIVDEYGLAFVEALTFLYPSWKQKERTLRVKLSHDADHVGLPLSWKHVVRHTTRYRNPGNSCRELWGMVSGAAPVELQAVREIAQMSIDRNLDTSVYWMGSSRGHRDSGYDPRHPRVREVIQWLDESGIENGVQPGYETFRSPERLRREISALREVLGDRPLGGRQHYLRWCPETWLHWETSGLRYDSSLGFADRIGFRAGTCVPYRPWLFVLNRPADLIEIPLLVMDGTLFVYMNLREEDSHRQVRECLERCRMVGGVFAMVWHNNNLLDPRYRSLYLRLLELVQSAARYDWKAEAIL